MANKIDTVLGNLKTALNVLATADGGNVLAQTCRRQWVNPEAQGGAEPYVAFLPSRISREDTTWTCEVGIQLVCRSDSGEADDVLLTALGHVDRAIEQLAAGGSAGGRIDRPSWQLWYSPTRGGTLSRVGCVGTVRIRVIDPLETGD